MREDFFGFEIREVVGGYGDAELGYARERRAPARRVFFRRLLAMREDFFGFEIREVVGGYGDAELGYARER